jgi:hypothetical protein
MATIYVSNSTSNGYQTGSNANSYLQAQSTSTPWLTIAHAVAAARAGDTIVVNNGTYSEDSGSGYLSVFVANLTLQPDSGLSAYGVTIRAASGGAARVLHVAQAGQGLVVGAVVLDGQSLQTECVSTDSSNQLSSLTFHGTMFQGGAQYGLWVHDCANFLMDQNCQVVCAPSLNNGAGVHLQPNLSHASTDVYSITNCTVSGGSITQNTFYGVYMDQPAVSAATLTVSGNTITLSSSGTTTLYGIVAPGGPTYSVTANTITVSASAAATVGGVYVRTPVAASPGPATVTGNTIFSTTTSSTGTAYGILCYSGPTFAIGNNTITVTGASSTMSLTAIMGICSSYNSTATSVYGNTITGPKGSAAAATGHGIDLGGDVDTAGANIHGFDGALVYNNAINGCNHGILCCFVSNAKVYTNQVQNVVIGLVDKLSTDCQWTGNTVSLLDGSNAALRGKGSTRGVFASNLVLLDNTCNTSTFIMANADPIGPVGSTGMIFSNNLLYATAQVTAAVNVDPISAATFTNNNYYSTGGFGSTAFQYRGTTYSSVAAWAAAQEATATNTDPTFFNYVLANYRIPTADNAP